MKTHISIITNNSSYSTSSITQSSKFGVFYYIILFILFFLLVAATAYIIYYIYEWLSVKIRTKKITETPITATIINKEYHAPIYCGYLAGRMYIPRWTDEHYSLDVLYEDEEYEVYVGKSIYQQTEKGESIDLILVKHFDKNGKVIQEEMELPE